MRRCIILITVICLVLHNVPVTYALRERTLSHVSQPEATRLGHVVWEEIMEEDDAEVDADVLGVNAPPRRTLLSFDVPDNTKTTAITDDKQNGETMEPHPLRTDRFLLKIVWRRKPWSNLAEMREMIFEFNQEGHARYMNLNGDDALSFIGEWDASCGTLCFQIPMSGKTAQRMVFTADVSLNPFGPQPKLFRGVILEETQRSFGSFRFRNVLGTFTGQGIGDDMVDLSYRGRKRSW